MAREVALSDLSSGQLPASRCKLIASAEALETRAAGTWL
jgi:hypothetical protein